MQEQQNLIETWKGTTWSYTPSPDAKNKGGATFNQLDGVSCTSATNCIAVGYWDKVSATTTPYQTLVESWNGTVWSIVRSPNHGTTSNYLNGVSCASPTDCVAVGYYLNASNEDVALIESWNGTRWSIAASPDPSSTFSLLYGVSCPAMNVTFCAATGIYTNKSSTDILMESWNGSAWSVTPNKTPGAGSLIQGGGISCTSATFCVAVNEYYNNSLAIVPLVESWNGSDWSVTSAPRKDYSDGLQGVSCSSSISCVAVGLYEAASGDNRTLVESWNGVNWSVTPSPNPGSYDDELLAVSCESSSACTAAGHFSTGGEDLSLVETGSGT